jgi:hypothetical protein
MPTRLHFYGLVEHVGISTLPEQQLYNSEMSISRRGMQ